MNNLSTTAGTRAVRAIAGTSIDAAAFVRPWTVRGAAASDSLSGDRARSVLERRSGMDEAGDRSVTRAGLEECRRRVQIRGRRRRDRSMRRGSAAMIRQVEDRPPGERAETTSCNRRESVRSTAWNVMRSPTSARRHGSRRRSDHGMDAAPRQRAGAPVGAPDEAGRAGDERDAYCVDMRRADHPETAMFEESRSMVRTRRRAVARRAAARPSRIRLTTRGRERAAQYRGWNERRRNENAQSSRVISAIRSRQGIGWPSVTAGEAAEAERASEDPARRARGAIGDAIEQIRRGTLNRQIVQADVDARQRQAQHNSGGLRRPRPGLDEDSDAGSGHLRPVRGPPSTSRTVRAHRHRFRRRPRSSAGFDSRHRSSSRRRH